jgi:hypothetical protein
MDEIEPSVTKWVAQASHLIGELFDLARPYLEGIEGGLEEPVRFISSQLFLDCHFSSESVLILVSHLKEWDAELINRAIIEGTVKYVYLMDGEAEDRRRKAYEYWNLIPDFMSIKRSERAKVFLRDVDNPDSVEWLPFKELVISDAEIDARRHGMNRQQRSVLEEDWSFSGIVKRYSQSEHPGLRFMKHLAHGYGMSSHLLHKDGEGIGMVWERYQREPRRQAAVKFGHLSRLVSDVCSFAKFRTLRLLNACKRDVSPVWELQSRYQSLEEGLNAAASYFSKTEYNHAPKDGAGDSTNPDS